MKMNDPHAWTYFISAKGIIKYYYMEISYFPGFGPH